ncbi:hypothetical protein Neosp_010829 [[Neocosmospora] mangrovei]
MPLRPSIRLGFAGLSAAPRRAFAHKARHRHPPPPPFNTVATCPEPTCGCADTPAMPEGLPLDREGPLKAAIAGYAEQVLVCTDKSDWPSRIEEDNSGDNLAADLKELFGRGGTYSDPFHNVSVLNSSFPSSIPPRVEVQTTSAYLLPSFKYVPFLPRISFDSVQALAKGFLLPKKLHSAHENLSPIHRDRLTRKEAYQGLLPGVQDVRDVLVLICGHGGRDARCGIMAPVLETEFKEKLKSEGLDVLEGPVQVPIGLEEVQRIQGEAVPEGTTARVGLISHIGGHKPDFSAPKQARVLSPLIFISLIIGGVGYYLATPHSKPDTLNDISFVPYAITHREAISPTSFVITIVPHKSNPSLPYLTPSDTSSRWSHPLWSVEFKQPEVQISRHYTPLPPLANEDPTDGALHFYIRAVGDGEMSHYLARRQVGQDVFLRGPHVGFELAERLGEHKRLVFLAGGTGVVPGMQAAKAVLETSSDASVDLLWAVRKREEIQNSAAPKQSSWKFWQEKKPTTLGLQVENPSPVTRRLQDLKATYGDRLNVQVVVDEEGTKFQDKDIKNAILASPSTAVSPSSGCRFHDQMMHVHASEFALPDAPGCACSPPEGTPLGKNLFIVSGPDGFIEHYAGAKIWLGGQQTQGRIGGIAGQLQRQNPTIAQDWLVLKM